MKRKKTGIMGGTFDPVHMGHLILAEKAYEQLGLDHVLFMPSGNPPHKQHREGRASDEERVRMVELAIKSNPHFKLSLMEMNEEGYTYTFRTLETLKKENPDTDYYFIIGADSLYSFHSWMEPARIASACILVVAKRDQTPEKELKAAIDTVTRDFKANIILLDTMNIDVSSQMLREWVQEGKSIRYYTPDPVADFIKENHIYARGHHS